jgi:hypothetical protein
MTNVERFRAALWGEPVDRLPRVEWASWWQDTLDRWYTEGLPPGMDRNDVGAHLGLDLMRQVRVGPLEATCPRPERHGGPIMHTADDYARLKQHLYPSVDALAESLVPLVEAHDRGEVVLWLTVDGFFWFPRRLFGIQDHFYAFFDHPYAFFDHPELMHRINQDLADHSIAVIERLGQMFAPEFVTFAEDMSYNHGPMLSEALFDEFLAPYYEQVVPAIEGMGSARENTGARFTTSSGAGFQPANAVLDGYETASSAGLLARVPLIVDSDGDVTEMMPWLERVGARGVLPLERQAGVDAMEIRRRHPESIMVGHYDKMVMTRGEAAMRAEFERLLPVMRSGRFIPSVDHQTPPGVSFEEYHVYLRLLDEYSVSGAPR